jgi:deazaflavin-dependent oxidoreductase (nitroreductase family)
MADHLPVPRWLLPINRALVALGLGDALRVRGRKSGQVHSMTVNVLERDGRLYLVSARGNTQWVRNVRAAGEVEVRHRGSWRTARVREVPPEERRPLIDAYLERWGWQVGSQFKALPEPEQHPVFELLPS